MRVLNLFAYSGGSTLAAALGGAEVCHLDASKGMVQWARDNAKLNGLEAHPIRWITDDAHKFLCREVRRERRYDAVILDPPTFGRGQNNELYKIEKDLPETLHLCRGLLSDEPLFMLLSAHTPGYTPVVLGNVLGQAADGFGTGAKIQEQAPGGDCEASPVVSCTEFSYDELDQLVGVSHSDDGAVATPDVVDIAYDGVGRRVSMTDGTGTSSWEWSPFGELVSTTAGNG